MAIEFYRRLSEQLANLPADDPDRGFLEGIAKITEGYINKSALPYKEGGEVGDYGIKPSGVENADESESAGQDIKYGSDAPNLMTAAEIQSKHHISMGTLRRCVHEEKLHAMGDRKGLGRGPAAHTYDEQDVLRLKNARPGQGRRWRLE